VPSVRWSRQHPLGHLTKAEDFEFQAAFFATRDVEKKKQKQKKKKTKKKKKPRMRDCSPNSTRVAR